MLTAYGVIVLTGLIACTMVAFDKRTPEESLKETIDENTRQLKDLEYELRETNRRSR